MLKSVVVGGLVALALFLVPAGMAAPPGQVKAGAIKRYVVHGVYTREQRSQLVRQGYDIGEAYWADHVELYGTDAQARALALHGFRVAPSMEARRVPARRTEGYHNYAEMVTDLQALAAAHPSIVHLFSLGSRTRAGTSSACASPTTRPTTCPSRASSSSASTTRAST